VLIAAFVVCVCEANAQAELPRAAYDAERDGASLVPARADYQALRRSMRLGADSNRFVGDSDSFGLSGAWPLSQPSFLPEPMEEMED
jgi:hypothetical protein